MIDNELSKLSSDDKRILASREGMENYTVTAVNKVIELESGHKVKVIGYTMLSRSEAKSFYMPYDRMRKLLILLHKLNKPTNITNLELGINYGTIDMNTYYIKELTPIKEEGYFYYTLTDVLGKNGKVRGWALKVLKKPINNKFKCPSEFEGFPVISLYEAFGGRWANTTSTFNKDFRSADFSGMNVRNIITMEEMLGAPNKLRKLSLKGWKPENCINAYTMIYGCHNLEELDARGIKIYSMVPIYATDILYTNRGDMFGFSTDNAIIEWQEADKDGNKEKVIIAVDNWGLSYYKKLIISKEIYNSLKEKGYRKIETKQDLINIRNKCKLLNIPEPYYIRAIVV